MTSLSGLTLKLVGEDGNAFSILGRAKSLLNKKGKKNLVKPFLDEAMGGDYNHLLQTCQKYFSVR